MGNYRRNTTPHPSASFFDTSNKEGERMRKAAAEAAVNDMSQWFQTPGNLIAILDATNSTKSRRRWIKDRCDAEGIETLFVESKCDDEELIMANIKEVKLTSPDYAGLDPEDAAKDFRERIRMYDRVYETLDEDETDMTYCKIIDVGSKVIINRIQDYLQSRVVYYLMNLHIKPRSIWISRVSPPFTLLPPFLGLIGSGHPVSLPRTNHSLMLSSLIPARRIPVQPLRQNRRRRRPLPPRRAIRPHPALPGQEIRRRPPPHRLDVDAQTHGPNGPLSPLREALLESPG